MEEIKNFELTKEFIDQLRNAIEQQQSSYIQSLINNYNIQDISAILEELDFDESKYILDLTSPDKRASIINELEEDIQSKFLKEYSPAEIARIIENLDSDDAVDILGELS
ncbi:MAG: magnesium transporter, partial [Cyclobacteriaceae bacterium]|nr:magnesium transporter [Cyclobacteriaceae bacterium]